MLWEDFLEDMTFRLSLERYLEGKEEVLKNRVFEKALMSERELSVWGRTGLPQSRYQPVSSMVFLGVRGKHLS